jgi:hypothetical protein
MDKLRLVGNIEMFKLMYRLFGDITLTELFDKYAEFGVKLR